MKIAVIGGTGDMGRGLAMRCARASHDVVIGSRNRDRAQEAAERLNVTAGVVGIRGMANADAAAAADLSILTVPYSTHSEILDKIAPHLNGKILIDVTVPLSPPAVRTVHLPAQGSAAKSAQGRLGDTVRVVSAFQNVAAARLADFEHSIECDVLVCGNDRTAREVVIELAAELGMKGWHAGRIDNSVVAEAMTSVLIFINAHYKIHGAGIRISGETEVSESPP